MPRDGYRIKYLTAVLLMCLSLNLVALSISHVSTDRAAFNPGLGESADIRFHLDQPASVELTIYDPRDQLVRRISAPALKAGDHRLAWNGRDEAGKLVPNEAYIYTLSARSEGGETVIHDLTDITGGERIPLANLAWNPETKTINYGLKDPARVVIRAGLKNHGPLLRTVLDWLPRNAGNHNEKWDGLDASGVLELTNHPNLELAVDAFTLPANHVIVQGRESAERFISNPRWQADIRPKTREAKPKTYAPHLLPAEKRGDFPLNLTLLGNFPTDNDGVPTVSGTVAIRLDVDEKYLGNIASQRFEPVFYVDGFFVYENEVGFFPMTYKWDSHQTNNGIHFVTANLRGYLSNFGMATLKMKVDNPATKGE